MKIVIILFRMSYLYVSKMITQCIDIQSCKFFLFLNRDRRLGPKFRLIKRSSHVLIKIVLLSNTESNKMILRAETPIRQGKKGHYDELIESAGHNTADLR